MWLEAVSLPSGDEEKCPTCGCCVQRRHYGEMHAGSFVLDGQRVEIRRQPAAGFIDPVVLDPLTQYFDGGLYRLWPSERYYTRGGKKLHRDVWQSAFGPIPGGCHIHHRDSNPANNSLANLECMEPDEHQRGSRAKRERLENGHWFSEGARAAAAEWHKSEAGRLWHKRHAERSKSWTKWKRESKPCANCGHEFDALVRAEGRGHKFCGPTCKSSYHFKHRMARLKGRRLVPDGPGGRGIRLE